MFVSDLVVNPQDQFSHVVAGMYFRSKYVGHDVQLTATKQTKFQLMNVDENFLDSIYEPREVNSISFVKNIL